MIVALVLHCLDDHPGAAAIAPRGDVVGDEAAAEGGLVDAAALNEALGDAEGHLRVIGVPEFAGGIFDEGERRGVLGADGVGGTGFEAAAEGIGDGAAEQGAFETLEQRRGLQG